MGSFRTERGGKTCSFSWVFPTDPPGHSLTRYAIRKCPPQVPRPGSVGPMVVLGLPQVWGVSRRGLERPRENRKKKLRFRYVG